MSLSLSHWYPGSGVVLVCIDSWSLHPYLLPKSRTIYIKVIQVGHLTYSMKVSFNMSSVPAGNLGLSGIESLIRVRLILDNRTEQF